MGKIIAVANQKGGVGKTTTCVNLTCALKKRGRRVLLIDCDPQGNSTSGMGVDKTVTPNCYDLLMNGAAAADCISSTKYGDVLPANMNLSGCSVELVGSAQREYIMKKLLLLLLGIASSRPPSPRAGAASTGPPTWITWPANCPRNIATSLRNTTKRSSRPQSARSRLRPGRPEILLRRSKPSS